MEKTRIPTGPKAMAAYATALVLAAAACFTWKGVSYETEVIALDLGLICAVIAAIMYPLFRYR